MNEHTNLYIMNRFYNSLNFKGFKNITDERKIELDKIVLKWYSFFHNGKINDKTLEFMSRVARRLLSEREPYGLKSSDEIAYFFMNIVDPELIFLECYESANTKKDIRKYCRVNFQIYDPKIIFIEKYYNIRFKVFKPDEIWTLERIKKEH